MTDDPAPRPLPASDDPLVTDDGVVLETAWSGSSDARAVAVLTHPHPRYGGDMHNAVPAGLARTLPEHGIATLRFNFRGTGASAGDHGGGEAEIADVEAAIRLASAALPGRPCLAVGYSFGADVLLATPTTGLVGVVAVAPPLAVLDIDRLRAGRGEVPTLLCAPEHDQFRPAHEASAAVADWPNTEVAAVEGADHFLAGAGSRLRDLVVAFADRVTG